MKEVVNINKPMFKMVLERAGYTQTKLAKEMGISKNALNNKVNGRVGITVSEAAQMCKILGVEDNDEKVQIFLN